MLNKAVADLQGQAPSDVRRVVQALKLSTRVDNKTLSTPPGIGWLSTHWWRVLPSTLSRLYACGSACCGYDRCGS